jgi:hypothetical protein
MMAIRVTSRGVLLTKYGSAVHAVGGSAASDEVDDVHRNTGQQQLHRRTHGRRFTGPDLAHPGKLMLLLLASLKDTVSRRVQPFTTTTMNTQVTVEA